jgi:hypothetical protein
MNKNLHKGRKNIYIMYNSCVNKYIFKWKSLVGSLGEDGYVSTQFLDDFLENGFSRLLSNIFSSFWLQTLLNKTRAFKTTFLN